MIKDIKIIFKGLERAHGVYNIPKTNQKDHKVQGEAFTTIDPVTDDLWDKHINGKQGLGIVPITDNNTCFFGAIDIDKYDINLNLLEKKIEQLKFPLILCRTKSGGAHLYIFFKDEISAKDVRLKLSEFSTVLGYTGSEIFPKQEQLAGENDVGNWINMPYFNGDKTDRYAIKKGKKLTLKQFINYAKAKQLTAEEFDDISILDTDEELKGAPPCLKALAAQGVPQGGRNSALFNFSVYLRNRYGDAWKAQVDSINNKYLSPCLSNNEISVVIKSVDKKDYFFTCKQPPIISFCNKDLCRKCDYGIGYGDNVPVVSLGSLTKILTDPPIWIIDVNSIRFELATDDLTRQDRFRKLCMEKINVYPPRIKTKDWETLINDRLTNCEMVEAPDDAGPVGIFWHYLRQFCTGPAQANTKDEILSGKVWVEEDRLYFRSADLMAYLDRYKFRYLDGRKIWSLLQENRGAKHSTFTLKGVKTKVWHIKPFEEITDEFDVPHTETAL